MCASVLGWLLSEAPFNFYPQYLRPWACTAFLESLGLVLGLKPLGQALCHDNSGVQCSRITLGG